MDACWRLRPRCGLTVAGERPSRMGADGCYQIMTSDATSHATGQRLPAPVGLFPLQPGPALVWVASQPGAAFTVRYADGDAPLATCPSRLASARSRWAAPRWRPRARRSRPRSPRPTRPRRPDRAAQRHVDGPAERHGDVARDATPTLTPTVALPPSIRLVYDDQSFRLVIESGQPLDLSDPVFVQTLAGGEQRSFEASTWRDTQRMQSGGCYQLLSTGAPQIAPPDSVCERFLGWYRTTLTERYFWMADGAGATFTVRAADDPPRSLLRDEAGECAFFSHQ